MMVVYRGADQRPFERRELEGVERLLPHVSSSLRTYLDLHEAFAFRSALGEALEVLPLAVILLDGQGQALFVNAAARRVLDNRDGLFLERGILRAVRRAEAEAVRRLMRSSVLATRTRPPDIPEAPSRFRDPLVGRRTRSESAPIRLAGFRLHRRDPAVAVLFSDPDQAPVAPAALLHQLYGLTAAEARLAVDLCAGDDLREIAARNGLSIATVRTHLKHLLAKTGTRRQGELVSLLLRGPLSLIR